MISLAGHFQNSKRLLGGPGGYCYSRHNSAGRGLGIYPGWVVIQRTFSFLRGGSGPGLWGWCACWNRPHIFLQSAAPKAKRQLLLLAAQFPGQPFPHRVVIDNTIGCATGCGGPVGWGCYSLHILKRGVPAGYFPGFCTQDCYSAHIFSLPMRPYLSQYR